MGFACRIEEAAELSFSFALSAEGSKVKMDEPSPFAKSWCALESSTGVGVLGDPSPLEIAEAASLKVCTPFRGWQSSYPVRLNTGKAASGDQSSIKEGLPPLWWAHTDQWR